MILTLEFNWNSFELALITIFKLKIFHSLLILNKYNYSINYILLLLILFDMLAVIHVKNLRGGELIIYLRHFTTNLWRSMGRWIGPGDTKFVSHYIRNVHYKCGHFFPDTIYFFFILNNNSSNNFCFFYALISWGKIQSSGSFEVIILQNLRKARRSKIIW